MHFESDRPLRWVCRSRCSMKSAGEDSWSVSKISCPGRGRSSKRNDLFMVDFLRSFAQDGRGNLEPWKTEWISRLPLLCFTWPVFPAAFSARLVSRRSWEQNSLYDGHLVRELDIPWNLRHLLVSSALWSSILSDQRERYRKARIIRICSNRYEEVLEVARLNSSGQMFRQTRIARYETFRSNAGSRIVQLKFIVIELSWA